MFYRILHDPDLPKEIPHYIILTQYLTRKNHPYHYILPHTSTTYYQQNFSMNNKRMEQSTPNHY